MHCDIVARASLRDQGWFLEDVGMHVLFGCEFFVAVELTGHLEDVPPLVVLCFRGFVEGHKSAVCAQCRSGVEGQSVDERMI